VPWPVLRPAARTDPERARWRALFARVRTRVAATIAEPGWIDRVRAASRP
jgi:hypothetical protein